MKHMRNWLARQPKEAWGELALVGLFVCFFSLGQLGRISLEPYGSVYLHDLIIVIWLLSHLHLCIQQLWSALKWLPRHPLIMAALFWIVIGLAWGLINQFEVRPLLIISRALTYALFASTLSSFFHSERLVQRVLLITTGMVMIWLGFVQYWLLPDTRFLSILGWDDHYFRMIGPLFDPNFMGLLIVQVMILLVSIQWLLPKRLLIPVLSFAASALALTYSRASYAAAALAALLLVATPYPLKRWRMIPRLLLGLTVTVVFAISLTLAPKPGGEGIKLLRTSSIAARQETATQTVKQLSMVDLVIGEGLFTNPLNPSATAAIPNHAQVPDNIILLLLSGTGIIGTVLIVTSFIYWIGRLAAVETALAILLAVTFLHAQFNNSLFEPFLNLFLLLAVFSPINQYQAMKLPETYVRTRKAGRTKRPGKRSR